MKKPKTLKDLENHPWVESISIETSSGDGYWVYLKEPYICDLMELSTIHEYTVKELCYVFNNCVSADQEEWNRLHK
tara:strand:+ start:318 stop:545 length:228 start_codon:yes stop_codon:yes gene_type:complete